MRFGYISPTKLLSVTKITEEPFHLTLAHLIEQNENGYVAKYLEEVPREAYIIMDNSAFELYKEGKPMFEADKLLKLAKTINADCIVLPDYPARPGHYTRDAAKKYAPLYHAEGYETFYVPQSKIGDLSGLIDETLWALQSPLIDYIGISILAVPNAFGVEQNNKLQRYLSRHHFMQILNGVCLQDLGKNLEEVKKQFNKKIHFLGMVDGPNEIALMRSLIPHGIIIDTWDSSSPVWAGYCGISYDDSPTGLIDGKVERHVNFSAPLPAKSTLNTIESNKWKIASLVRGYNKTVESYLAGIEAEKKIEKSVEIINNNITSISSQPASASQKGLTISTPGSISLTGSGKLSNVEFKTNVKNVVEETPFRFQEGEIIEEIRKYIASTYKQHYVSGDSTEEDSVQLMDLIACDKEDFIAFNRWNAIKYVSRYGKKDGFNRKDLLKAAHYIILLLGKK